MVRSAMEVLLIICLAVLIGRAVWAVLSPEASENSQGEEVQAFQAGLAGPGGQRVDRSVLTQFDPFSASALQEEGFDAEALDAPETSLNLDLTGVRAESEGKGAGFIRLPDNTEGVFEIGDEVLDGVVLEYVFADRVALRTRGKLETLYRRDNNQPGAIVTLVAGDVPDAVPDAVLGTERLSEAANVRATRVSPKEFLENTTLAAVRKNGVKNGYKVFPKADPAIMKSIGFETGDVIREINSQPVANLNGEDLTELFTGSSRLDLMVERDGEIFKLPVLFATGAKE